MKRILVCTVCWIDGRCKLQKNDSCEECASANYKEKRSNEKEKNDNNQAHS